MVENLLLAGAKFPTAAEYMFNVASREWKYSSTRESVPYCPPWLAFLLYILSYPPRYDSQFCNHTRIDILNIDYITWDQIYVCSWWGKSSCKDYRYLAHVFYKFEKNSIICQSNTLLKNPTRQEIYKMLKSFGDLKIPVHVEVGIRETCLKQHDEIIAIVKNKLQSYQVFYNGLSIPIDEAEFCKVCDISKPVSFWQAELIVHAFRFSNQDCEKDFLEGEEDIPATEQWELPNLNLLGLWDSVVVEDAIKSKLLGYCDSSLQFGDAGIDSTIISWNRIVLLHGPPGTGKTTLCKGLAQKIYIRNSGRYRSGGMLVEVNSHSLFSKWFSESGKLVMKLFDHISEIADDPDCFVAVLIDEVESITAARQGSVRSNEPGDAVRVVNSVLTSLDALKRRPNVLVLCTSNMLSSVDSAFRDRIDMMCYLGNPPLKARYQILHSCITELMMKGLIYPPEDISNNFEAVSGTGTGTSAGCLASSPSSGSIPDDPQFPASPTEQENNCVHAQHLLHVSTLCEGLSGRSLRKLPIKAHACHLQRPVVSLSDFLSAMQAIVQEEANAAERGHW